MPKFHLADFQCKSNKIEPYESSKPLLPLIPTLTTLVCSTTTTLNTRQILKNNTCNAIISIQESVFITTREKH